MSTAKIHVLPEHIVNKIAAGEVIERPASVVKELVENAMDAGADEVIVVIRAGGKELIQIIDNGSGMTPEDAALAFERHATSKIVNWEDLMKVRTFGFRGEALASIASVSDVEIKTKTRQDSIGTFIRFHAGVLAETAPVSVLPGTTVTVKNLFYNVPARRNFLKSETTEYRHIIGVIKKFALACPSVSFSLIHNDENIFQYAPGDLSGRIRDVFGKDIAEILLPVNVEQFGARITGVISKPGFSEKTRGEQYLFLNGRPIYNRTVNYAAFSAYGQSIPKGDKPFFILFLEWSTEDYDVNVHPTKAEVKFRDEQLLYRVIYYAVREALTTSAAIPALGTAPAVDVEITPTLPEITKPETLPEPTTGSLFPEQRTLSGELLKQKTGLTITVINPSSGSAVTSTPPPPKSSTYSEHPVWQLHNRYIVSQIKSGLAFIDQHVAHERVLYERALDAFERSPIFSQQLLFPQAMDFTHDDFAVLEELIPLLEKLGFVIKKFGRRTIVIEAIPADVRLGNEQSILSEMISYYRENESRSMDPRDNLAKAYACKSAIKSGDKLSVEEMNSLIDQLFATKFPYVCPHGRPIIVQLSLEELDKRFLRTK